MSFQNAIESIREKLDIVEIVKSYILLKKSGKDYKALCPFHNEKTPSFTVSQDKQIFYCFGCGEGGDVFKFVMKIEGLTFAESARKLAHLAGIEWNQNYYTMSSAKEKETAEMKKVMEFACSFYRKLLSSSIAERARDYLFSRKINSRTIEKFSIGFAPFDDSVLITEATKKGWAKDLLLKTGLAVLRDDNRIIDFFRGRIMFPIKNASGHVIAFGARVVGDSQPKYLNSPETELFLKRKTLYGFFEGMSSIRKYQKVLLLEGYMDVITAHQYGIEYAVAPLGTSLSVEHLNFIKRYTKEPIIMFDSDESGKNALIRNSEVLISSGLYARAAELPGNMDPDEFLHKYGRHAFEEILNQSVDLMDFQIKIILQQFQQQPMSPMDKSKGVQILLESVRKQPDEIIKREWIKNISVKFGIPQETILLQMKKGFVKSDTGGNMIKNDRTDIPAIEMGFIHLLLKNPELIKHAREISEEDFQSDFSKKIFSSINNLWRKDKNMLVAKLVEMFPHEANVIMKLSLEEIKSDVPCQESISRSVKLIKKFSKERKWKRLKEKISNLSKTELEEFKKLTLELKQ